MAYGTAAGVSALVPAVGTLSTISLPTLAQVDAWLEQGAATIDRALAGAGFGTPVAALAGVYPELAALNELYAAAYVVMARGLDAVNGENESRSVQWLERFDLRLAALAGAAMLPGVEHPPAAEQGRGGVRMTRVRRLDGYARRWDERDEDA